MKTEKTKKQDQKQKELLHLLSLKSSGYSQSDILAYCELAGLSQGVDCSDHESLFEYGFLLNPNTGQVLYFQVNTDKKLDDINLDTDCCWDFTCITKTDLLSDIEDQPEGLFKFAGQDKETYKKEIENGFYAGWIQTANAYNGLYQQSCNWSYDVKGIIRRFLEEQKEGIRKI
jgi:hypothetical protein